MNPYEIRSFVSTGIIAKSALRSSAVGWRCRCTVVGAASPHGCSHIASQCSLRSADTPQIQEVRGPCPPRSAIQLRIKLPRLGDGIGGVLLQVAANKKRASFEISRQRHDHAPELKYQERNYRDVHITNLIGLLYRVDSEGAELRAFFSGEAGTPPLLEPDGGWFPGNLYRKTVSNSFVHLPQWVQSLAWVQPRTSGQSGVVSKALLSKAFGKACAGSIRSARLPSYEYVA